jgi:hypothetical protein
MDAYMNNDQGAILSSRQNLEIMEHHLVHLDKVIGPNYTQIGKFLKNLNQMGLNDILLDGLNRITDQLNEVLVPIWQAIKWYLDEKSTERIVNKFGRGIHRIPIFNIVPMPGARITGLVIDEGIQSCREMSAIISRDLGHLIDQVNELSQVQQDQNFEMLKDVILPRQTRLKDLSRALHHLADWCQDDVRPLIMEFSRLQDPGK